MEGSIGFLRVFKAYIAVIFCLIIFTGCATKEAVKSLPDEEVLRERIVAYWNHKVKQEFDKSYEYEDPYFRKKINMVNYIKSFHTGKSEWAGAKVEGLKIEGDSAIVDMKVMLKVVVSSSRNIKQDVPIEERWAKADGIWYHVPKKSKEQQKAD